jgi:hypothetical protein
MWVRLDEWMVGSGEIALPDAGAVLAGVGIRIRGAVDAPSVVAPGITALDPALPPSEAEYGVHGVVTNARDIFYEPEFDGQSKHGGCEFLIAIDSLRLTGEVSGVQARDWTFKSGSALTLRGYLEVIAEYEWDDVDLPGERRDWTVRTVLPGPRFHVLDLKPRF